MAEVIILFRTVARFVAKLILIQTPNSFLLKFPTVGERGKDIPTREIGSIVPFIKATRAIYPLVWVEISVHKID